MNNEPKQAVIGVVGVCGSGKSTLAAGLRPYGIQLKHIAQEHSYVPAMWQRLINPDLLIFLDCSYAETIRRRKLEWREDEYQEQHHRLRHARSHADLYLFTDGMNPQGVLQSVLDFLRANDITLSHPDHSAGKE